MRKINQGKGTIYFAALCVRATRRNEECIGLPWIKHFVTKTKMYHKGLFDFVKIFLVFISYFYFLKTVFVFKKKITYFRNYDTGNWFSSQSRAHKSLELFSENMTFHLHRHPYCVT